MKRIYLALIIPVALTLGSCADKLNTMPTADTGAGVIFSSVESAQTAVNGIYRFMQSTDYTTSFQHENFGQSGNHIAFDLAGDDMIRRDLGSQWFVYDHLFWVRYEIASTADRPYAFWNFYYKIVASANNILVRLPEVEGNQQLKEYLLGQAYALRAYAYYHLVNLYQLTYFGNENAPGVPVYTEVTDRFVEPKGRGTVEEVYTQINNDLTQARTLLAGKEQQHISHIDEYVAYGLSARVALMQRKYEDAKRFAELALTKPGLSLLSDIDLAAGFNNYLNTEWMWGFETLTSQVTGVVSFMYHMDATSGYAQSAGHGVGAFLYHSMDDNDVRKQTWWNAPKRTDLDYEDLYDWEDEQNYENDADPSKGFPYHENSYLQTKFRYKGEGILNNDMLYMRAAEMYLIIAEASILQTNPAYGDAISALNTLLANKIPGYDAGVFPQANKTSFDTYADPATFQTRNLLDEVYFQRRVELWGEGFRLFDLSRLKLPLNRYYDGTNFYWSIYGAGITNEVYDDVKWDYTMMIPLSEINNNPHISNADQNPEGLF